VSDTLPQMPSCAFVLRGWELYSEDQMRAYAAAAVAAEREHWQHVAQVQQASYEREIVIEVEAERERIIGMQASGLADLIRRHERELCAQQLDALGCDHCAAAIRATPPPAPAPADSAPA
jgi:hypothetical protein